MRKVNTDVEFVEAWMASATREEVAILTGLRLSAVGTRASRLRAAGVPLPRFARHRTPPAPVDVGALTALIAARKAEAESQP